MESESELEPTILDPLFDVIQAWVNDACLAIEAERGPGTFSNAETLTALACIKAHLAELDVARRDSAAP